MAIGRVVAAPVRGPAVESQLFPPLKTADHKTAAKLKTGMTSYLKTEGDKMKPTTGNKPKYDANAGVFMLPGNPAKPLLSVTLKSSAPWAGGGGSSQTVLVDPSSNKFWKLNSHGMAGGDTMSGPGKLPTSLQFHGTAYSTAQIKLLTTEAQ